MEYNRNRDASEVGIDTNTYEELWNNIDVEIGPGILPDLRSVQYEAFLLTRGSSECLFYSHEICRNQIKNAIEFSSSQRYHPGSTFSGSSQYLIARLVMDTVTRKESIFHRRRIAVLPGNQLALVPASTHPGDIVCCFAGSDIPYVLRPHESSPEISDEEIHRAFPKPKPNPATSTRNTALDCRRCQWLRVSIYSVRKKTFY
jgi:hypothetical protein